MAKAVTLDVEPRSERGRGEVRKLRANGFLPGVIYGPGIAPRALSVPRLEFIRTLNAHGMHALVTVRVNGGEEYLALVKEVQIDPVRYEALHIDFQRVEEDKPVQTEAVVEVEGTPEGVTEGGVLEVQTRSVAVEALPRAIPEVITFDVSHLAIGDVARVGDLVVPAGVTILTDPEETLCSVATPRVEEAEVVEELTPEEAAALAELSDEEREALAAAKAEESAETTEEGEEPAGGDESE